MPPIEDQHPHDCTGCWRCCETCNYDRHRCPGCGTVAGHDNTLCPDCVKLYEPPTSTVGGS